MDTNPNQEISSNHGLLWDGYDQRGNHWTVRRYSEAMPHLIHWLKWGSTTKLLDQVAQWNGDHWGGGRWRPGKPVVPDAIRQAVEAALREVA